MKVIGNNVLPKGISNSTPDVFECVQNNYFGKEMGHLIHCRTVNCRLFITANVMSSFVDLIPNKIACFSRMKQKELLNFKGASYHWSSDLQLLFTCRFQSKA